MPLDNDIGLFFRSLAVEDWARHDTVPKVIAVTGSNGKSTTSALIHHILEAEGRPAQLAGNIGRGVLDIDPPEDGGIVVLELSSYQIELARALTPDVAVFTNLTPDHLDRHGGLGGYFAAKRRLFVEGGPDHAVVGVDEPEGRFLADRLAEGADDTRLIRISSGRKLGPTGWSVFARKGFLAEFRRGRQVASVDLREIPGLPGAHNHQNACAAYAALRAVGLSPRAIEAGLRSFAGLPHRSQRVAEIGGVIFVNDSKATNADSAAKALQAFDRIHWIAGGLGKEGGITGLAPHFGRVARAYLIGHSARDFALQLGETPARGLRRHGNRRAPGRGQRAPGRHGASRARRGQLRPVRRFRGPRRRFRGPGPRARSPSRLTPVGGAARLRVQLLHLRHGPPLSRIKERRRLVRPRHPTGKGQAREPRERPASAPCPCVANRLPVVPTRCSPVRRPGPSSRVPIAAQRRGVITPANGIAATGALLASGIPQQLAYQRSGPRRVIFRQASLSAPALDDDPVRHGLEDVRASRRVEHLRMVPDAAHMPDNRRNSRRGACHAPARRGQGGP